MPISKSDELLKANCTKCHTEEKYKGKTMTDAEWDALLKKMQVNGAKFNYDDMKALRWYKEKK